MAAPASATPGSTIAVTTGAPTTKFSLMRMSTVTHTVNTDQRRIPLTATAVSGNTASLTLPSDTGVLVPGNYLLFAHGRQRGAQRRLDDQHRCPSHRLPLHHRDR